MRAATAFDAARSAFDQETLGRAYESAIERFDRIIFDLYEITPEKLGAKP